jgi:hypothetical protein
MRRVAIKRVAVVRLAIVRVAVVRLAVVRVGVVRLDIEPNKYANWIYVYVACTRFGLDKST